MKAKIAKTKVKTIKQSFVGALKYDKHLKTKLAEANSVSIFTIERWLRNDDPFLTTATNLTLIKEHFGLSEKTEILNAENINAELNMNAKVISKSQTAQ